MMDEVAQELNGDFIEIDIIDYRALSCSLSLILNHLL